MALRRLETSCRARASPLAAAGAEPARPTDGAPGGTDDPSAECGRLRRDLAVLAHAQARLGAAADAVDRRLEQAIRELDLVLER